MTTAGLPVFTGAAFLGRKAATSAPNLTVSVMGIVAVLSLRAFADGRLDAAAPGLMLAACPIRSSTGTSR